jgi:SAM-dependent methyltransferase
MRCLLCQQTFPKYESYGVPPRIGKCPNCGSKPRHRELAWFFQSHLEWKKEAKVLEIGPSKIQTKFFVDPRYIGEAKYTGIDVRKLKHHDLLKSPHRFLEMDVTRLSFSDQSFDVIICNHVFPFIRSDYMAMSEIHRCLKATGLAILNVQIGLEKTKRASEMAQIDPDFYTEEYRIENGTEWVYGEDFFERLEAAGFFHTRIQLFELVPKEIREMGGFREDAELFCCFKFQDEMHRFIEGVSHR